MTIPVPSGYPDFGRYQAQSTKVYFTANLAGITTMQTFNLGYVGDIPNLNVACLATLGSFDLTFYFTTVNQAGFTTGIHQVTMRPGLLFEQTVPVLGPFCQVIMDVGTTPISADITIVQATVPFKHFDVDGFSNVLASNGGHNIGVGNTFVVCNRVLAGPAVLYATIPPVAGSVSVYARDKLGNFQFLTRIFGASVEDTRPLFLPAKPIELQLNNPGPGNQDFMYSLTAGIGAD